MSVAEKLAAAGLSLVLCVTAVAYIPVVGNDFVNFDDHLLIVENPFLKELHWRNVWGNLLNQLYTPHYKPLVYLSWMVEYNLFGPNPIAFHLGNLALHLANTALVFFVALRLCRWTRLSARKRLLVAFFSSLFFGIHPLHVESVAWAVERKDVLFSLFYLLATLSYVSYADGGFRKRWLVAHSAGFYLLAVLSKGMSITFAVVPFLVDGLVRRRPRWVVLDKVPFLVVLLAACFLYGLPGGVSSSGGGGELLDFSLVSNFRFLAFAAHVFAPLWLSVVYPAERLLASVGSLLPMLPLITIGIALALFRWRKESGLIGFSCLFFAVTISPALAMPVDGANFLPDRYTYMPSLGLLLVAVYTVFRVSGQGWKVPSLALGIIALVSGLLCYQRCLVWRNSEALWSDAIRKFPNEIPAAYVNRGNFFFKEGDYALALRDYERALEVNPASARAHKNKGAVFARRGDLRGALREMETAIELDPTFIEAFLERGMTRTLLNEFRRAEDDYEKYLSVMPLDPKAYFWRGLNRRAQGRHLLAVADFTRAMELNPEERKYETALSLSSAALAEEEGAQLD